MNDTQHPTSGHSTSDAAWQEFLVQQCNRAPLDGVVTAIAPFGAFVRLHDAVDGLLHRSEWSAQPRVGDTVSVRILQIDLTRHRVSLAQV